MNRRLYLVLEAGDAGTLTMRVTIAPPSVTSATAVLLVRGMLYEGREWAAELVADPTTNPALRGPGPTAAQVGEAAAAYLQAHPPAKGDNGLSAEMRVSSGAIQWRLQGGQWAELIPLSALVGAAGATSLGTATLERSGGVTLTLGDRDFDVSCPGLKKNDVVTVAPIVTAANPNGLPSGWALRGWLAVADNILRLRMTNPLLAIGTAYSMSFRVVRHNVS